MGLDSDLAFFPPTSDLQVPFSDQTLSISATIYNLFSALLNSSVRSFKCSEESLIQKLNPALPLS